MKKLRDVEIWKNSKIPKIAKKSDFFQVRMFFWISIKFEASALFIEFHFYAFEVDRIIY